MWKALASRYRFGFFRLKKPFGALWRHSLLGILLQVQGQLSHLRLDLADSSLDIRLLDGAQLDIQQRAQARGDSGMKFTRVEFKHLLRCASGSGPLHKSTAVSAFGDFFTGASMAPRFPNPLWTGITFRG
jgi:hypothetical protein